MTECLYERIGEGKDGKQQYRCTHCGHKRESKYPPSKLHRNCGARSRAFRKVSRFAVAAALHAMRGSPKRTEDEITKLHAICKPCGRFKDDVCRLCGCRVTRKKVYRNKLAWADQHCDEGRW